MSASGSVEAPGTHQVKLMMLNDEVGFVADHPRLGKGHFGSVRMGFWIPKDKYVAIKSVVLANTKQDYVDNESEILMDAGRTKAPGIVHGYGIINRSKHTIMVMELLTGGTLQYRVVRTRFNEAQAAVLMFDLACGLRWMHDRNWVHRDVKGENLLLYRQDDQLRAKLADMGLARKATAEKPLYSKCGTWAYSAPEMLAQDPEGYTQALDMWAVGVLAYISMVRFHPFERPTDDTPGSKSRSMDIITDRICNVQAYWSHPDFLAASEDFQSFVRRLLVRNPHERMTAAEAMDHPWIRKNVPFAAEVAASFATKKVDASLGGVGAGALPGVAASTGGYSGATRDPSTRPTPSTPSSVHLGSTRLGAAGAGSSSTGPTSRLGGGGSRALATPASAAPSPEKSTLIPHSGKLPAGVPKSHSYVHADFPGYFFDEQGNSTRCSGFVPSQTSAQTPSRRAGSAIRRCPF